MTALGLMQIRPTQITRAIQILVVIQIAGVLPLRSLLPFSIRSIHLRDPASLVYWVIIPPRSICRLFGVVLLSGMYRIKLTSMTSHFLVNYSNKYDISSDLE